MGHQSPAALEGRGKIPPPEEREQNPTDGRDVGAGGAKWWWRSDDWDDDAYDVALGSCRFGYGVAGSAQGTAEVWRYVRVSTLRTGKQTAGAI
jgi:hypothetical protein